MTISAESSSAADGDLWFTLTRIAELAARAVPGADGVGITLVVDDDRHSYSVASDAFVGVLDAQQVAYAEGPSMLAARTGRVQQSEHLDTDPRWPQFGRGVASLGVQSAIALPLIVDGDVRGTLEIYAYAADAFTTQAARIGSAFAESAGFTISSSQALHRSRRLVDNLNDIICDAQDVECAVGILMARATCSHADALNELRDSAADEGRSLADASRGLVRRAADAAQPQRTRLAVSDR